MPGSKKFTIELATQESLETFEFTGIDIYMFCEDLFTELTSLWNQFLTFFGGLGLHGQIALFQGMIPDYQEKANVDFYANFMDANLELRDSRDWTSETATIDPDLIQSGDALIIMRMDGLDQFIGFGVGSHIGHTTMALRFDGELYIVET
jgi:hypothetical protein